MDLTTTSGTSGTLTIGNGAGTCVTTPYYPYYNSATHCYDFQIRRCQNGYIVMHNSQEYAFTEIKELIKFIEKQANKK